MSAPVSYIPPAASYTAPVATAYQPQAVSNMRPVDRIPSEGDASIESSVAAQVRLATARALRSAAGQAD